MDLEKIIDLKSLQEIQDCFAEATGFAAIMVDYRGQPLLKYSNFSRFCSKIREDKHFNEKCYRSDAIGSLEAARRGTFCMYRCHAGLVDFAVPIMVNGEYVASMMCGQILAEEGQDVSEELIRLSDNIFASDPDLLELYSQIPVLPFKRIRETANLLYLTLNYIVQQYHLNQKNIKLLNDLTKSIELERQFKDLEFQFYNSQVNPHFLFNALNIAGRQAYLEDAKKTQEIIYALADMYRYFLQDTRVMITVEEELINVKNYMFIQSLRFGEQLKFGTFIDEEIFKHKIPAMTLLIFVENAVRHGIELSEELGTVSLSGEIENDTLRFTIADNGAGMPHSLTDALNNKEFSGIRPTKSTGLGIYNVHKRLEYFYPGAYSITFESRQAAGTKVLLSIPASV